MQEFQNLKKATRLNAILTLLETQRSTKNKGINLVQNNQFHDPQAIVKFLLEKTNNRCNQSCSL